MSISVVGCQDACFALGNEIQDKVLNHLKEEAKNQADASMDEHEVFLKICSLVNWGVEGFEYEFRNAIQGDLKDSRLECTIDLIILKATRFFDKELPNEGILQSILLNKV